MKAKLTVAQIFKNADLRNGEAGFAKLLNRLNYDQRNLMNGYVYLFVSRDGYKVKILGNNGIIRQEIPNPWDFNIPVAKAVAMLGQAFLVRWTAVKKRQEPIAFGAERKRRRLLKQFDESALHSVNL